MSKRKRKQERRFLKLKNRPLYPVMYCLNEDKPIAVSHVKCFKNQKVKVSWEHWKMDCCEFVFGYEIDMMKFNIGDVVKCPVCNHEIDFRFWPSDTVPHLK